MNGELLMHEPMAKHTTYGIGGPALAYFHPANVDDLVVILKTADEKSRFIQPKPQPKESPKFNLEYRKTGPHGLPNRIHPIFGKSQTILEIRSGFGIGSGKARLNRGEWPATLVVRLYLKGLEGLTLSNGTQSYKREDLKVLLFDLEGKPMTKGRYLLEKKGYYEAVVPRELLGPRFKELEISWVDFSRRGTTPDSKRPSRSMITICVGPTLTIPLDRFNRRDGRTQIWPSHGMALDWLAGCQMQHTISGFRGESSGS